MERSHENTRGQGAEARRLQVSDGRGIGAIERKGTKPQRKRPHRRAGMLFVKPLSRKASTNTTVVTSARQYAFNLAVGPRGARTPWVVRFAYPQTEESSGSWLTLIWLGRIRSCLKMVPLRPHW